MACLDKARPEGHGGRLARYETYSSLLWKQVLYLDISNGESYIIARIILIFLLSSVCVSPLI